MPQRLPSFAAAVLALGLAVTALAPVAKASPVLVRDGDGGSVFGGNGLGTPPVLGITVDGVSTSVLAGPFALQYSTDDGTSWASLLTYCLEPDEPLGVSTTPGAGTLVGSLTASGEYAARASSLARIYQTWFGDALGSATKGAAFQVAVWELAYDGGGDLGAGAFRLETGGAVAAQAQAYLNAAHWVAGGEVGVILRQGRQDLLVVVPEPASLGLLATGCVLLAGLRRRAVLRAQSVGGCGADGVPESRRSAAITSSTLSRTATSVL